MLPYGALKGTFGANLPQYGLCVKTYDSDIFNNWVDTDWIDGDEGISAITAVSTEGNELNLDSLNLAQKVYNMLNRIAVSGGTYRDWLETVYASGTTITLNKAETGAFDSITGLRQSEEWDFEGVQLLPFALENIDKMRDKILQTPGNNTLLIQDTEMLPYGALKNTFAADFPR